MKRLLLIYLVLSSFIGLAQETKTQLTTRFDVVRNAGTGQNTAARIANAYQELSDGTIGVYPVVASGTDTYTGSLIGLDAYTGRIVFATFPNNNTGAATLNLNSIGATSISKDVSGTWTALAADDILAGKLYRLYHDGTRWQIDLGGSGGGGSFTLTDGELTTANGTAVDVGGTASADVDLNLNTHEFYIHGGTYNTIEGSNEQVIRNTGASGAQLLLSPTAGAELDGGTENATLKGASIALNDNGDVGGALDFIKSDGASGAVWGTINADDLATLTTSRTFTSSDDLDQTDNLRIVYTDCAAPCNVTVDLLSTGTQVTIINNGASTATLIEGSGVTLAGTTIPIATGESALIIYETAATPDVYLSTASGGGSGDLTIGTSTITGGTSNNFLYNNAGVVGERTPGTGVATWFQTPSYSNLGSALTGTSLWPLLSSGGTLTGVNTYTSNQANGLINTSTFTATAASQFAANETGTLTARATINDPIYGRSTSRTFVASANSNQLIDLFLNPTFTNGAFTTVANVALLAETGSVFIGSGIANSTTKLGIKGTGTTSSTLALNIKDNANSDMFMFYNNGTFQMRQSGILQLGSANDYISSGASNTLTFSTNATSNTTPGYRFRFGGSPST